MATLTNLGPVFPHAIKQSDRRKSGVRLGAAKMLRGRLLCAQDSIEYCFNKFVFNWKCKRKKNQFLFFAKGTNEAHVYHLRWNHPTHIFPFGKSQRIPFTFGIYLVNEIKSFSLEIILIKIRKLNSFQWIPRSGIYNLIEKLKENLF